MPHNCDATNKRFFFLILLLLEDFVLNDTNSIFTKCPSLWENLSHSQLAEDLSQGVSETSLVVTDRFSFFWLFFVVLLAGSILRWLVVLVYVSNCGKYLIIDWNWHLLFLRLFLDHIFLCDLARTWLVFIELIFATVEVKVLIAFKLFLVLTQRRGSDRFMRKLISISHTRPIHWVVGVFLFFC